MFQYKIKCTFGFNCQNSGFCKVDNFKISWEMWMFNLNALFLIALLGIIERKSAIHSNVCNWMHLDIYWEFTDMLPTISWMVNLAGSASMLTTSTSYIFSCNPLINKYWYCISVGSDRVPSWRTLLYDFTQDTTLHGIRYITADTWYNIRR